MKISEIADLVNAEVLCRPDLLDELTADFAYAADLMSDVLAFARPGSLLLTGLTNVQIVRTAQMLDIPAVVFVRGKHPQKETVELASRVGMPLLLSRKSLYETSGIIYQAGLKPCEIPVREE